MFVCVFVCAGKLMAIVTSNFNCKGPVSLERGGGGARRRG